MLNVWLMMLLLLAGARALNNQNPLGTAAGYGTTLADKQEAYIRTS